MSKRKLKKLISDQKKLKNVITSIYEQMPKKKVLSKKQSTEDFTLKSEEQFDGLEYDKEVSEKFINFINRVITLDNAKINVYQNSCEIVANLDEDLKSNGGKISKISNKENYFTIGINRSGFRFSKSYSNQISYKDTTMFDILYPTLLSRSAELSKENMKSMIDEVMTITKLSRGSNLDTLLG